MHDKMIMSVSKVRQSHIVKKMDLTWYVLHFKA